MVHRIISLVWSQRKITAKEIPFILKFIEQYFTSVSLHRFLYLQESNIFVKNHSIGKPRHTNFEYQVFIKLNSRNAFENKN